MEQAVGKASSKSAVAPPDIEVVETDDEELADDEAAES
ncbi:hypothetical protein SCE1572_47610 [Sorangium cellulosum So0157-2]|uniref:Uncharacterized protein n=1 Tax=Sorangium cellulosum So0157-2 TaxID=1254432 RepID=S4YAZ6_SORCE|nr:hypothetical protein SCE1572_47610 [Sorangium cellulosum So0157-2]